jgi:hypothetical protein
MIKYRAKDYIALTGQKARNIVKTNKGTRDELKINQCPDEKRSDKRLCIWANITTWVTNFSRRYLVRQLEKHVRAGYIQLVRKPTN